MPVRETASIPAAAPPASPSAIAPPATAGPWRRSELRPDDQILDIVDVGTQPAVPLRDDARTGYVLRDGNSNRVLLIDTGPAPAAQVTAGTAVPSVQGSPVALVQGAALPLVLGRALPLVQGTAIPEGPDASPLGLISQVIASPALRDMAVKSLASEVSGDSAQRETPDGLLGSILSGIGSS